MPNDLATTNTLLGIMAAVSVIEVAMLIGVGLGAFLVYRRATDLIANVEARHLSPSMARVNAILDDVKSVTTTIRDETDRVDSAIRTTMYRVDRTAEHVRSNVRTRANRIVNVVRVVRGTIEQLLTGNGRRGAQ
jgi:hypothetical protein